eukprot:113086-Chlamydomonas_euryale.AAC.1
MAGGYQQDTWAATSATFLEKDALLVYKTQALAVYNANPRRHMSWGEFKALLKHAFPQVDADYLARAQLHGLKQGTSTVRVYYTKFAQLVNPLNPPPTEPDLCQ